MRSDAFRHAAESKDFADVDHLFTEDCTFRSPVVFKPYEGRDALRMILTAVSQVFENFRYLDQVENADTAVLRFTATVDDREVEGVDILKFTEDGQIRELTVMVRPMSGMHALAERMRQMLEAAGAA
ncbi:MAG: nuclear transport factor 2 family protein [Actinomycetota bacterium]|nr:nuclear transport factor 2 family protein [Actinomycetota bacterium]